MTIVEILPLKRNVSYAVENEATEAEAIAP